MDEKLMVRMYRVLIALLVVNTLFFAAFIGTLVMAPRIITSEVEASLEDVETLARDLANEALDNVDEVLAERIDAAVQYAEQTGNSWVEGLQETLRETRR